MQTKQQKHYTLRDQCAKHYATHLQFCTVNTMSQYFSMLLLVIITKFTQLHGQLAQRSLTLNSNSH